MQAQIGDRIDVAISPAGTTRTAKIVDLRGENGSLPYVIEWEDNGHRTVVTPGNESHITHIAHSA